LRKAIIDASALIQAVVPEEYSHIVLELIERTEEICVPTLFWYEVGNVLITLNKRGLITIEDVFRKFRRIRAIASIRTVEPKYEEALRLAVELRLTFYDVAYIELAKEINVPFYTADKELCDKAKNIIMAVHLSEVI
jgi:predicted nucleic acid-binding protein